jgi:hypothetical protein
MAQAKVRTSPQLPLQTSKVFARLLYATSFEFYQTYCVVEANKPHDSDFIGMKHYLLCHALELTLKGWLVDTGNYNENMLMGRKLGHNLEALAIEVELTYGQFPELNACTGFIQVLNADYKGKGYEYPINNGRFKGADYPTFAAVVANLSQALIRSIQSNKYPAIPLP